MSGWRVWRTLFDWLQYGLFATLATVPKELNETLKHLKHLHVDMLNHIQKIVKLIEKHQQVEIFSHLYDAN